MSGAEPPKRLYAFMARMGENSTFKFCQ